uniref:peptidylprolyl isomerase n=1 Tax=Schlesneria paludicola TaxID=360056 RepID=A0A7C4QTG4_9PLAN
MGEGNPLSPRGFLNTAAVHRLWLGVGGTVVVLLAGLVLMQSFRAQPGQAAPEPAAKAAPKRPDVARVGKETISYDMVAKECFDRYGKEVLEDLINRMIIQQACEEHGITITEEQITAEVTRIAKRFNLDAAEWYRMLQAERNVSPQQYRQSVIWPMLALKALAGEQVDITEEEMHKAFVRNYGPRVKAKLILINNPRRARECWEKCSKDPDNFEKFAQEYSIDTNSRALGGTIPPIPRYSGNDALESAAFKLKEGEISGLIEISTGTYAILKCEGQTEPAKISFEDVRDSLYEELLEQKTQQSVAKVFENLKKNAKVDNFLTQTSTGPNRPFAAQPAGAAVQQTSGQKPAAPNTAATARPAATNGTRPAASPAPASGTASSAGKATVR